MGFRQGSLNSLYSEHMCAPQWTATCCLIAHQTDLQLIRVCVREGKAYHNVRQIEQRDKLGSGNISTQCFH